MPAEMRSDKSNIVSFRFYLADLAASQSGVVLSPPGEATATDLGQHPIPWPGSIVGIGVSCEAARTGGTATFAPTINGTAISTTAVINATDTQYATNTARRGQHPVTAAQRIGCKVTTDASWAAGTTPSVLVTVYVDINQG